MSRIQSKKSKAVQETRSSDEIKSALIEAINKQLKQRNNTFESLNTSLSLDKLLDLNLKKRVTPNSFVLYCKDKELYKNIKRGKNSLHASRMWRDEPRQVKNNFIFLSNIMKFAYDEVFGHKIKNKPWEEYAYIPSFTSDNRQDFDPPQEQDLNKIYTSDKTVEK
ncbi:hypothetical protein C1645_879422 [Glomus cerebriforme]|uniref:HMG box domain-containing protein n=1 Tax=Glomus cerebriforme TaxID=658196 RepID=A0A397SMQ1_9GLOM|nr:hypothetical protein C1645_879422 [Glomus cerebriforme]